MKVLITGIAGFIGSNLTERLLSKGYKIIGIDNLSTGYKKNIKGLPIKFYKKDIKNFKILDKIFKREQPDYVIHLAALARIQPSYIDPIKTHDNNVTGTINILQIAKKYKVKKVVYAASSAAYGDNKIPFNENMKPDLKNPYSVTKYMGELYCKLYNDLGLPTLWFRFFNVYGKNQEDKGDYSTVIGIFLRQKRAGQPMTIVGDGSQRRDFTHVSDICDGLIKGMESDVRGELINLGSGETISVNDLSKLIGGEISYISLRPGEANVTLADIRKAKRLLKWTPKISINEKKFEE